MPPRDLVGKKYASCAIVGNSGMLVYSKNGAEIDSHDMVGGGVYVRKLCVCIRG